MKLEEIGFYTLSDRRAATTSPSSRLMRGEVVLTARCNLRCPYCREAGGGRNGPGQEMSTQAVLRILTMWASQKLFAVRFTGGEPTIHPGLDEMVTHARRLGIVRIAVSSNGVATWERYARLIELGVNDFSISLDACCAADGDQLAGGIPGSWAKAVQTIRQLSYARIYTTVGVVVTEKNQAQLNDIIRFAASLGPSDIRVITAAQFRDLHQGIEIEQPYLDVFPILKYRVQNMKQHRPVRGLLPTDSRRCRLVLDDMIVNGTSHYPCVIHFREGGAPIGSIDRSLEEIRQARTQWAQEHDTFNDPICRKNCIDCLADYNNLAEKFNTTTEESP